MRVVAYALALLLTAVLGCQHSETATGAAPSPARTVAAANAVAAPSVAPAPPAQQPSPVVSPSDEDAEDDDNVPMGPEFEIDADASRYFVYPPVVVHFFAHPLNGESPFSYVWDFADGSPPATGERVDHGFDKVGSYHVIVKGTDKSGELSHVELVIDVVSREDWARVKNVDPATLQSPVPTP